MSAFCARVRSARGHGQSGSWRGRASGACGCARLSGMDRSARQPSRAAGGRVGVLRAGVALTRGGWTGRSAPARGAPGAAGTAAIAAGGLAHVKASPPSWPPHPAEARPPALRAGGGVLACGCAVSAPRARGGLEARARAVCPRREARAGCRTMTQIRDQERPSCDRRATAECACLSTDTNRLGSSKEGLVRARGLRRRGGGARSHESRQQRELCTILVWLRSDRSKVDTACQGVKQVSN